MVPEELIALDRHSKKGEVCYKDRKLEGVLLAKYVCYTFLTIFVNIQFFRIYNCIYKNTDFHKNPQSNMIRRSMDKD